MIFVNHETIRTCTPAEHKTLSMPRQECWVSVTVIEYVYNEVQFKSSEHMLTLVSSLRLLIQQTAVCFITG